MSTPVCYNSSNRIIEVSKVELKVEMSSWRADKDRASSSSSESVDWVG